MVMHKV